MGIEELLAYLISTPGAGAVAYFIIKKVPWFWQYQDDVLRYIASALTAVISMSAFTGAVFLGFIPMPADALTWVSLLIGLALAAFGVATLAHAPELRKSEE
jgi:hypothetical protein